MNGRGQNTLAEYQAGRLRAEYEALPEVIKHSVPWTAFVWMWPTERARLTQRLTEPVDDDDAD